MSVIMIKPCKGITNENGSETKLYEIGEVIEQDHQWQKDLAKGFIKRGFAQETQAVNKSPETKKKRTKKKA